MSFMKPETPRPMEYGRPVKRGLKNEAIALERATQKIKKIPPQIPDAAVTGATLLIGGN